MIRDMVQVQRLAVMRPSEVFRMKPGEIDTEYKTDDGLAIWMYTPGRDSYNRAIKRSVAAANTRLPENERIPTWTPYQLRHAAITDIALQTKSLDTARAAAGQKSISVTQGYNHADVKIAIEQAVKRSQ